MALRKTCPTCGKAYRFEPDHAGKKITCKSCGTRLLIGVDSLTKQDDEAEVEEVEETPEPASKRLRRGAGGPDWQQVMGQAKSLSAFFFAGGISLILLSLFFPWADAATVAARDALVDAGDQQQERFAEEARANLVDGVDGASNAEARKANEERIVKAKKEWEKQRVGLKRRVDEARVGHLQADYWYTWMMFLGFVIVACSALEFLHADHTRAKRVVGAITLIALVIMMVLLLLFGSVRTGAGFIPAPAKPARMG